MSNKLFKRSERAESGCRKLSHPSYNPAPPSHPQSLMQKNNIKMIKLNKRSMHIKSATEYCCWSYDQVLPGPRSTDKPGYC